MSTQHEQSQAMKGKTAYISPEQARGQPTDPRSDLYSLAVIIFEFVAGRPLHEGSNHFVLFDQVQSGHLPALREAIDHLPEDFGRLLSRALAQDPEKRYQTALDLAEALYSFRSQLSDAQARSNLAQWLRGNFLDALAYHERSFERFERFEVLSDGQVVENAPSTEDATSMWDFSPDDEDGEPPTAAMRIIQPMEVSFLGGRLDGTPPPVLGDPPQPAVIIPDSRPAEPSSVPPQAAPVTSSTTHDVSHALLGLWNLFGRCTEKSATQTRVLSWVVVLLSAVLGALTSRA